MTSVAATRAPFSFRALILIGLLAAPMLLWSRMSFAFPPYLPAPLSALYWGCSNYAHANDNDTCTSWNAATGPNPPVLDPSLMGYVHTTQQADTTPLYWGCTTYSHANDNDTCTSWGAGTGTNPNPALSGSAPLAYIFTTQPAGTTPLYFGCGYYRYSESGDACVYWALSATNPPAGGYTSLLGYVYTEIPASKNFIVNPKYFIGSVIYVPPGAGSSSISYGTGTMTGTTVSTTESWSSDSTVGVSNIGNDMWGGEVTFGASFGGSTMHSVDMQRTIKENTTYRAPPSDSINHDYDEIQIFFGVKVNSSVDYLGNVTWNLDFSQIAAQGFATSGYPIAVGCLRSNSTVPPSLCTDTMNVLSFGGIIPDDYPSILGAHPFADPNSSPTPDPSRYVLIDSVFYFFNPTTTTYTYLEDNGTTITNSRTSSYSYSVNGSGSYTDADTGVVLKNSNKFTWTNSSTHSNRTGSTSSNTFTLSMPSSSYSGPTTLFVYLDTIYKTFMFSFNQ